MNNSQHRKTFAEIRLDSQIVAARAAWDHGQSASELRHLARAKGMLSAARDFSEIKVKKVLRVFEIVPKAVKVKVHSLRGHKLLVVKFRGQGLHLPLHYAPLFGLQVA